MKRIVVVFLCFCMCVTAFVSDEAQAQNSCTEWYSSRPLIILESCEYPSGGSGFYRIHNGNGQPVRVYFTLEFYGLNTIHGGTNIPANGTSGDAACFGCARQNGGLRTWSVDHVYFPGDSEYW